MKVRVKNKLFKSWICIIYVLFNNFSIRIKCASLQAQTGREAKSIVSTSRQQFWTSHHETKQCTVPLAIIVVKNNYIVLFRNKMYTLKSLFAFLYILVDFLFFCSFCINARREFTFYKDFWIAAEALNNNQERGRGWWRNAR